MPQTLLPARWALTPPFHPCQAPRLWKTCRRFGLRTITDAAFAGGLFSVALSVAGPTYRMPAQPPGVTRRAALRSPDFPPGEKNAQRSPGPLAALIIARTGRIPANSLPLRQGTFAGNHFPALFFAVFLIAGGASGATGSLPSSRSSKSSSLNMATPSVLAFSAFEPGSAPTTT
jgi:hypothetical protein